MKYKTICPFCKQPVIAVHFWKDNDWSYGCFNVSCKIRPKTKCLSTEEEARQEWENAYVE